MAELKCYGFKISEELAAQGHRDILAYVMRHTEGTKANNTWRQEIANHFPSLNLMSFSGPQATIRWLMRQIEKTNEPI